MSDLEFRALMTRTMLNDPAYDEDDPEFIRPIHVENYTEDLAAWIAATEEGL